MSGFVIDPAFESGSVFATDWPLCQVRLQNDARFPWLILIPRLAGVSEIEDLSAADRALLMEEIARAGPLVRSLGEAAGQSVEKLNVGALGNVTAQLHIHVVGRRRADDLWPDPVWGRNGTRPYDAERLTANLGRIRDAA